VREPHGVTGHIVPWNYPMQIIGRSVGAALAMGNACVLKPAEDACLTALAFGDIALEAGLPAGALNVVPGLGEEAGAALSATPACAPVVHRLARGGCADPDRPPRSTPVPVTLELGGKSPQIVFADADLERAAALPGQRRSSRTRARPARRQPLLVERRSSTRCVAAWPSAMPRCAWARRLDDLDVGPLISARAARAIVQGFLAIARDTGLPVAAQGRAAEGLPAGGFYVPPTLLAPVPASTAGAGGDLRPGAGGDPVRRRGRGPGASPTAPPTAWWPACGRATAARSCAWRAKRLHCGQVFVNNYGAGGGIELPFGGVKPRATAARRASRRCRSSMGQLDGKVAFVTGAGGGFGEGIAQAFVHEGARVAVVDLDAGAAQRVARALGAAALPLACDVSDGAQVRAAVAQAVAAFGVPDIIVNNAGTTHRNQPMLGVDEATFDRVFAVNVKSIYLTTQALLPLLRERGRGGSIINIGSTAGIRPRPGLSWYNASKGAVNVLSKS
jgi:hypothetical protein